MLLEALPAIDAAEVRQIGRIRRWQRGNLVGSGSYGRVYLAMDLDSAELFVVKQARDFPPRPSPCPPPSPPPTQPTAPAPAAGRDAAMGRLPAPSC